MGGANSHHSSNSVLTKKELERMQRRLRQSHVSLSSSCPAAKLNTSVRLYLRFPNRTSCNIVLPLAYLGRSTALEGCTEVHHAGNMQSPGSFSKACTPCECTCRIARLANGGSKVAIADMLQLPELSGNVLMEPILRLFDGDRDGFLTEAELIRAVQRLGELQQPDADQCLGEIHASV